MNNYGRQGKQSNRMLPMRRSVFNYSNVDNISGYHSFFSGATAGGDIVPDNLLVLNNDNSSVLFGDDFSGGFDTANNWNCVFRTGTAYAYLAESRNASASDGNNSVGLAEPLLSRLPIVIDAASSDGDIYVNESKNYLKLKSSGRMIAEIRGVFQPVEESDVSFFEEKIHIKAAGVTGHTATRANWNVDGFGLGTLNPSSITLDFSKVQTLVFSTYDKDIGDVRFGFLIEDTIYWAHIFKQNNTLGLPFSGTPQTLASLNLPIRDEIRKAGVFVVRSTGIFNKEHGIWFESKMNISTVPTLVGTQYLMSVVAYTIGGGKDRRLPFVAGTRAVYVPVTTANTPIFSIKANTTLSGITNRTVFNFDKIRLHSRGANLNDAVYIDVIYNGVLSNATFLNKPNLNSGLVYDTAADSITGGTVIYSGVIYANQIDEIKKSDTDIDYVNSFSFKSVELHPGGSPTTVIKDDILTIVASPFPGITTPFDVGAVMSGGEIA